MIPRLAHAVLYTNDTGRLAAFYEELLGRPRVGDDTVAVFGEDGLALRIHQVQGRTTRAGLCELDFLVGDIDRERDRLAGSLVAADVTLKSRAPGLGLQLSDPDGNIVWLVEAEPVGGSVPVRSWERTRVADQLAAHAREAYWLCRNMLRGLTDDEFHWEPLPGCWGVRPRDEATTSDAWGCGDWVVDMEIPPPSPPPVTTIAWRVVHAWDCLTDFTRVVFTGKEVGWDQIEVPHTAIDGVSAMFDGFRDLIEQLDAAEDTDVGTGGEDAARRWARITHGLTEAIHHGAEVGVLRDLYRSRPQEG